MKIEDIKNGQELWLYAGKNPPIRVQAFLIKKMDRLNDLSKSQTLLHVYDGERRPYRVEATALALTPFELTKPKKMWRVCTGYRKLPGVVRVSVWPPICTVQRGSYTVFTVSEDQLEKPRIWHNGGTYFESKKEALECAAREFKYLASNVQSHVLEAAVDTTLAKEREVAIKKLKRQCQHAGIKLT